MELSWVEMISPIQLFYNPTTSSYYHPPAFRLYESRIPITNFHNSLRFGCGSTCVLLKNKTDPIHDPFPPGTRVSIQHQNSLVRGTIPKSQFQCQQLQNLPLRHYKTNQTIAPNHQNFQSHPHMSFSLNPVPLSKNCMNTSSKLVGMMFILPRPQKLPSP